MINDFYMARVRRGILPVIAVGNLYSQIVCGRGFGRLFGRLLLVVLLTLHVRTCSEQCNTNHLLRVQISVILAENLP